jgi:hypothetical protein
VAGEEEDVGDEHPRQRRAERTGSAVSLLGTAIVTARPGRQKQQMPRHATAAKYPNVRHTMVTWQNTTPVATMTAAEACRGVMMEAGITCREDIWAPDRELPGCRPGIRRSTSSR